MADSKNNNPTLKDVYDIVSGLDKRINKRLDRLEDRINGRLTWLERRDWYVGGGVLLIVSIVVLLSKLL